MLELEERINLGAKYCVYDKAKALIFWIELNEWLETLK